MGDDLELLARGVVVHLEDAAAELSALECHLLDKAAYLIIVRVERQVGVGEVPHRIIDAVLSRALFRAHLADLAHTAGIDAGKGILLECLDYAEVGAAIDVSAAVGQLQTGMSIFVGVDIARRAEREQAGEERSAVGHAALDASQKYASVFEFYGFPELAAADVERHCVEPPLRARGFGEGGDGFRSILARIVYVEIGCLYHLAHLPVGAARATVEIGDYERGVLGGGCRQRYDGIVRAVGRIHHQGLRGQRLHARELDGVGPLAAGVHLRHVRFGKDISPPEEIDIVVHVERDAFESGE